MLTTIDDAAKKTAQMSMKKGLKIFRDQEYATMKKEMQQLHDRKVMQPITQKGFVPSTKERGLGVPNVSQEEMMWHNLRLVMRMGGSSKLTSPKRNRPRLPFLLRLCS